MIKTDDLKLLIENSKKTKYGFYLNENSSKNIIELAKKCKWPPYDVKDNIIYRT